MKFRQRWRLPYPDDCRYAETTESPERRELFGWGVSALPWQLGDIVLVELPTWRSSERGKSLAR